MTDARVTDAHATGAHATGARTTGARTTGARTTGARTTETERFRPGRLLHLRLPAGADLVDGVAAAAAEHGIARAVVRGGPGSLMHACIQAGGDPVDVPGPAAEILTLVGDLRPGCPPDLHGAVGDPAGRVFAGRFLPGRNPVCITVELVVEEMLPEPRSA